MFVLGTILGSIADNGNTRLMILVLLVLAIALIIVGGVIALMTLVNKRRASNRYADRA